MVRCAGQLHRHVAGRGGRRMPRQVTRHVPAARPASTRLHPAPVELPVQRHSAPTTSISPHRTGEGLPAVTDRRPPPWHRRQPWTQLTVLIIACDLLATAATAVISRSPQWCVLMGLVVVVAVRYSGVHRRRL